MRFRNLIMTSVLVGATMAVVVPTTAAYAGCIAETDYARTGTATKVWLSTNLYSGLVTGPGSISKTFTKTSEVSATASASLSVSAGVVASATAEVGVSLTTSSSFSSSWTYDIQIPSGQTARAHFFKQGYKIPTTKSVTAPTCKVTTTTGTTYAPVKSNSVAYYCDARDAGAITTVIQSSTCKPT